MATPSGILLHTVNKGNVGLLSSADVAFTIPELFRRAAARHPRKVAVVGQTWQPDYETLDTEANRVAHILCREGVSPGTRVAVLMPHDAPLFAAVLGVLKAGAVVVVLNPADPTVRMEQVLANAATETLLADPGLAAMAGKALSLPVRVLTWVPGQSELCADDPGVRVAPDSLAFLLYTSGTTGIPKGVMQSHENLVHNAYRFTCGLGLHEGDCISLFALLGGGQGVAVTWSAFLNGATLCPFPMAEKGVTGLGDWLARNEVSVFISTSSVFRHFMKSLPVGTTLSTVRLVRIGAEHAAKEDFEDFLNHFRDGCQFAHTFSSTEAGSLTQIFFSKGSLPTDERLSVGFPLPDVELHLHDASGREVPEGQIGEIVVRSRYLTPGYWRNETLTAARFRNDETTPGGRLFSTGDLARRSPDGSLMLVGRNDSQVKVRGHRIELTEVEIALKTIPGVLDSAACVVAEESGSGKLAAFVVTRSGDAHSSRDLREELKRRLPDHLVPSLFYFPQSLPLTAQGKLDRRALPHLLESPQTEVGNSPATDTEELLAHIWAGAFNHKVVSCDDDFFELGGDSLIAAVIAARIHDALGVRLELATFSNHLTVRRMSHEVDQRLAAMIESDWSPARLLTVERPDELPLSLAQERLWHFCQASDVSAKYVQTWAEQISGPLDVSILQRSIEEVVRRHEALRTTFMRGMQGPVQIVHPPGAVELPVVHLDNSYDIEYAAMDWLAHEARKPMDLEIGPVVRFCLIRLREQEHWLLRTGHHIVTDDWSWGIFYREVLHIYACMRKGMPPPWLEELPIQYADYALWQRLQHGTPGDREQIEWWKRHLHGQPQSFVPPFARQTPDPFAAPEDGVIWWGLPEPVSARLGHMARKEGVTFFALRLAAFAALLSFESGQDDFAFGAYFTNRQSVELQRLFGYFSNLATLRFRVERSTPFLRWLKQVREMVLAIQSHSEIPYESLCGQLRDESVNPPEIRAIFSSMAPRQYQGCDGLVFSTIERMRTSVPWGFSFSVSEECETSACKVSFDARIYDPDGVRCLISRFQRFMTVISERPELPLEELFLCATSDEEQGASWGVGECRSPMVAAWNCNHH